MRSVKDLVKRGLEGCKAWKKRWKILLLLGIVLLVAAGLFFAIPNPYRDAWDDLFLPYPGEFPKPGMYYNFGRETTDETLHFMRRGQLIPANTTIRWTYNGRLGVLLSSKVTRWYDSSLIADIEILKYIDTMQYEPNRPDDVMLYCLAVCKVHQIFAQREDIAPDKLKSHEEDVITVVFPASSKYKIGVYPELEKGQRFLVGLKYAEDEINGRYNTPGYSQYCVADYSLNNLSGHIFHVQMFIDESGQLYADASDMMAFHRETIMELDWENLIPLDLIDQKTERIYDMQMLKKWFEEVIQRGGHLRDGGYLRWYDDLKPKYLQGE